MKLKELVGKVQTVLGPIDPEDLGFTLIHEHILSDFTFYFKEPEEVSLRKLAYQPVDIRNLSWVKFNPTNSFDNLILSNKNVIIDELKYFKQVGGKSIVECTPFSAGRDPSGLFHIAQAAKINIIMGSGYYTIRDRELRSDFEQKNIEEIAEEIEREIIMGIGDREVCSGIIGEILCSWPLQEQEKKVLKAAAIAQKHTGASLSIHPGWNERSPFEIIKILEEANADITRTIMDHMGRTISSDVTILELAKTGCFMEYDAFGREYDAFRPYRHVNDAERIMHIIKLIDEGFINQVVISRDVYKKIDLAFYGGGGYASLLTSIIPKLIDYGISQELVKKITVDNPKHILTFR